MKKLIFRSEDENKLKLLVLDEEIRKDGNKYYFIASSYSGNTVTERKLHRDLIFDIDYRQNHSISLVKSPYDKTKENNATAIIVNRIKNLLDTKYEDYKCSYLIKSMFRYLIYLEQMHFTHMNMYHARKHEILTEINNFIIKLKNKKLLKVYENFNFGSVARLHNIDIGIYFRGRKWK